MRALLVRSAGTAGARSGPALTALFATLAGAWLAVAPWLSGQQKSRVRLDSSASHA